MRQKNTKQLPLMNNTPNHIKAVEYDIISEILDANPKIYDLAHDNLTENIKCSKSGAYGMSTEQVVRAAILMKREQFSYEGLAFHMVDSTTFRKFCHIGLCDAGFKKSTLNNNIKALSSETWEAINDILVIQAEIDGHENGRETRTDCTVTLSNIHDPRDSEQLWDCVRVLTRKLELAKHNYPGFNIIYTDHTKRAKRRALAVLNAKNEKGRKGAYRDLLVVTKKTIGYCNTTIEILKALPPYQFEAHGLATEIEKIVKLARQVIDQTERRVIKGESVPASEKVVSIFEPHTDIIVKDSRDTLFGHKICLTGGRSNLILDCLILDGNPADSTLPGKMADRLDGIFGRYPNKMSFDGGFAALANVDDLKGKGIKDICFSKRRGMDEEDMCRSKWVYRRLRNFRAGIESGISWLKGSFGLGVCIWKGYKSFKSYVWSSIVAANLTTLARLRINSAKAK